MQLLVVKWMILFVELNSLESVSIKYYYLIFKQS
jgi:hypothetical protein